MSYVCGFCAVGRHSACTGLLRAQYGFCACADRQHRSLDPEHDPIVKARNEAIYRAYVETTLHAGEN